MIRHPPRSPLFPYPTLFRSLTAGASLRRRRRSRVSLYVRAGAAARVGGRVRSEEHTSELQSQSNLVCRLLLEKKKSPAFEDTRALQARPPPEDGGHTAAGIP